MHKHHKSSLLFPVCFWLGLFLVIAVMGLLGWYWMALVHFGYGIPSRW